MSFNQKKISVGSFSFLVYLAIGIIYFIAISCESQPRVDLPEEYMLIKPQDDLQGTFDSKGILHIEFKHKLKREYVIELIDGESDLVRIKTSSGRTYNCHLREILEIIEKDNL